MTQRLARPDQSLWAITSYFNPQRYRRRLANYRMFRRELPIPLVAVELSFGEPFELTAGDADVLIQLSGGDVMWQKERLLNLALQALPDHCHEVAWLDADVLIGDDEWPARVHEALTRVPLVQAFDRVGYLRRDARSEEVFPPLAVEFWQPGFVHAVQSGQSQLASLRASQLRVPEACALGFAWAARRDLLDEHGLYDACIIGGGDVAFTCAAYGLFQELEQRQLFNDHQQQRYRAWAEAFHSAIRSQVATVASPLFHLWHGEMSHRHGRERHEGLAPFHFDPDSDLALAASGAWRWNSLKLPMHHYVRDYFALRQEDG